jgi:hypothetical protein
MNKPASLMQMQHNYIIYNVINPLNVKAMLPAIKAAFIPHETAPERPDNGPKINATSGGHTKGHPRGDRRVLSLPDRTERHKRH